jgi:hypothetical protein
MPQLKKKSTGDFILYFVKLPFSTVNKAVVQSENFKMIAYGIPNMERSLKEGLWNLTIEALCIFFVEFSQTGLA